MGVTASAHFYWVTGLFAVVFAFMRAMASFGGELIPAMFFYPTFVGLGVAIAMRQLWANYTGIFYFLAIACCDTWVLTVKRATLFNSPIELVCVPSFVGLSAALILATIQIKRGGHSNLSNV